MAHCAMCNIFLGFIAFSGAFCTLALFTSTSPVLLHFSYITSMVFLIVSFLLAFPYFYYLFDWLDPVKIIHRFQAGVSFRDICLPLSVK